MSVGPLWASVAVGLIVLGAAWLIGSAAVAAPGAVLVIIAGPLLAAHYLSRGV